MTLESLKLRLTLLYRRVRNDYWPRLRQDIATREPRSLFLRALLIGFLLSVPWQCTRMAYNAFSTGGKTETAEADRPLSTPGASSSVTGMPNPRARRASAPMAAVPEAESADTATDIEQATEPAPAEATDQDARVVERKALEYPDESLRKGEAGSVIIRVRIAADGTPSEAEIEQSSGFRNLDRAARKAVMRWTFAPKMMDGTAVESEILVPVDFKLGN